MEFSNIFDVSFAILELEEEQYISSKNWMISFVYIVADRWGPNVELYWTLDIDLAMKTERQFSNGDWNDVWTPT